MERGVGNVHVVFWDGEEERWFCMECDFVTDSDLFAKIHQNGRDWRNHE